MKTFTRFTHNSGKWFVFDKVLNEIFVNSVNVLSIIESLEKEKISSDRN